MTTRRTFLGGALAGAVALATARRPARAGSPAIAALAFDAFTVFDPRPLGALAERLVPGRGAALVGTWRTRQFEYSWLRTTMQRYADFWTITEDALVYAAEAEHLVLTPAQHTQLMHAHLALPPYPDARPALTELRQAGLRLALLTNLSPRMLDALLDHAGLTEIFETRSSTDAVQSYKPDPRAYQLGVDALRLDRAQIGFVASAGWDAAGARAFGYPTLWINRPGLPMEEVGARPDAIGTTLRDAVAFVRARERPTTG